MTSARHLMVDFNQMKTFDEDPLVLDRGLGIRVWDADGKAYIDGLSGVFTSNLGHGNEAIVAAVSDQLGRLAFGAPTMATTTTTLRLVDQILEIAPPQFTTMKFLSGGSEATEAALKLSRQFHRQTGRPGKYKVLSHYRGYHGATGNALAASGWPQFKTPFEPPPTGFVHLPTPDPVHSPFGPLDREQIASAYAGWVRETILMEGPETVAAFITEPVLMSAGVIVPPESYLPAVRRICDEFDVLLIFDEIITGFGRTGTWFAAQTLGAWPDIICAGKGVTGGYGALSMVLMTDRVASAFWGEPEDEVQFHSGHTYGGNPVASAAALASIDYILKHGILGRVTEAGERLRTGLEGLRAQHPIIRRTRGIGLLQALVLSPTATAPSDGPSGVDIARAARRRGLLLRASGWFVSVAPPLTTTDAEIDELVGLLDLAISDAEGSASQRPS